MAINLVSFNLYITLVLIWLGYTDALQQTSDKDTGPLGVGNCAHIQLSILYSAS